MRFIAPTREGLDARLIDQPIFDALEADRDLLSSLDWPTLERLNERVSGLRHTITGQSISLVAPIEADPENYEVRILRSGRIATRADNWHDLFNALVWTRFPRIKSALNRAQVLDMDVAGNSQRTRRQDALTQFDEAGAIVVLRDAGLLDAWDCHDWPGLFLDRRDAWTDGSIRLHVLGHALFEHALNRAMLLVGKCVVLVAGDGLSPSRIDQLAADAIQSRSALADPQDLRPLPFAGIPGWHHERQDAEFYGMQPCFRPLRPGRIYPPPSSG